MAAWWWVLATASLVVGACHGKPGEVACHGSLGEVAGCGKHGGGCLPRQAWGRLLTVAAAWWWVPWQPGGRCLQWQPGGLWVVALTARRLVATAAWWWVLARAAWWWVLARAAWCSLLQVATLRVSEILF